MEKNAIPLVGFEFTACSNQNSLNGRTNASVKYQYDINDDKLAYDYYWRFIVLVKMKKKKKLVDVSDK